MPATAYDARAFHDGLVRAGLIIPARVPGVFARGAVFEDVLARFDAAVTKLEPADFLVFPPVIERRILEQVGYMDSFPQLAGTVHGFTGKELDARKLAERIHAGGAWGDAMTMTDVALNPAACYPLYPTLPGTIPAGGRVVTMLNWVFRREPSPEPTRMQAFRVREYVACGAPELVIAWRDRWLERGMQVLESLGLAAKADVATDPFFGKGGKMLAASQLELELKFEVLVPVISREAPTACCSFNYHEGKFTDAFGIALPDGAIAHTACLGFGLERCAMALFQEHGFDPGAWPSAVRARLWA
ncbi:MAG TPA: amino acid--[acyl-carrier-protein] ligase [Kofleriaceae bacterium]|jgi:seryl-tRNA synthetase